MNKHQKELGRWFTENGWEYWKPHEITARLFEEGGEFARLVNHLYGPKKKKTEEKEQELEEEIGDIMYTLMCFANSHNIDLDNAVDRSFKKVMKRDKDRF